MRIGLVLMCVLFPIAARADDGAAGSLRGSAAFDNGRGHVALGGGYESFGVEAIGTGLIIGIDGDTILGKTDDRIDGGMLDGRVSYLLPGETERTWFGRNTRLGLDIAHGRAESEQVVADAARTISAGFALFMSSGNGRAFAYSTNGTVSASAYTGTLGTGNTFSAFCSQTNGNVSTQASAFGAQSAAGSCSATASAGTSSSQSADADVQYAASTRAIVLSGAPFEVSTVALARYDIEDTRGEASMSGDFEIAPSLTLSPSLALIAGRRQQKFLSENAVHGGDGVDNLEVFGVVIGTLTSKDVGLQAGSMLTYELAPGLDVFGSAKAAAVHRRSRLQSVDGAFGQLDGASVGIGFSTQQESQERTAFQGGLEVGGSYAFGEDLGLGELRAALVGGLRYDSGVASYRRVQASASLDPPYAPAGVDFASETDFYLKAEVALELP